MKVAVSLMAGMLFASYLVIPFTLFPLLVAVVLLAFCLWRYEHLQSAVIGLCFVVLGTARITATLSFGPFKDLLLRTTVEVVGPAL